MRRETTRRIDLDLDRPELAELRIQVSEEIPAVPARRGSRPVPAVIIRPTWIQERLLEFAGDDEDRPRSWDFYGVGYRVRVGGPVQTKAGQDAGSRSGGRIDDITYGPGNFDTLPDPLRALLIGPEAMRAPFPEVTL